ncbi:putative PurR-regulated permease PerM [Kineococcus radiotolerans]|uniref:Putative PurR-regulated permease PerM n=1 Tax=Kineococcus radiotolerans TaxID=131568 RepID=A0A7W4XVV3_KINRA|nr:AI-2E family transporter [Kineococcus radiotolerans]MBB2900228.1 putative PurR-regulated permease PerM [Kineococcus radiotolerans]
MPSRPVSDPHRPPYVSPALRLAADWSWRFLVVVAGVVVLARGLGYVSEILVPVLVALLVTALLGPVVARAHRLGVPQAVAALVTLLVALAAVAGLVTLISTQAASGFSDLSDSATEGIGEVEGWLASGPLNLSSATISGYVDQVEQAISDNRDAIVAGATTVAATAGHLVAGFFITLFATFFYLLEGRRIWSWLLHLMPQPARDPLDDAARQSWLTLVHYMRATVVVALVDGAGVAIGAAVLQVPLAVPLGLVVFLGAFIPIVGALLSGVVAVLVALVAQGPVIALIMLGVILLVQQVESHLLQPFLMGRAVAVHPLAVILSVAAGATVFGIVGALFAVPLVAVLNTAIGALAGAGAPTRQAAEIAASDAPLAPDAPAPNDATEHLDDEGPADVRR